MSVQRCFCLSFVLEPSNSRQGPGSATLARGPLPSLGRWLFGGGGPRESAASSCFVWVSRFSRPVRFYIFPSTLPYLPSRIALVLSVSGRFYRVTLWPETPPSDPDVRAAEPMCSETVSVRDVVNGELVGPRAPCGPCPGTEPYQRPVTLCS